ncbi:glycoside hydrolase family 16 protein [Alphaproteobacteria bacterium]|nr:glycoside hydrolase family 16 protein [Alphaproteobacteria bacterium]
MRKFCNSFRLVIRLSGLILALAFTQSAAIAQSPDASWNLIWADEFNGTALDQNKWNYEDDCWGGGNEERQCYTQKTENVEIANGLLTIRAIKEKTRGFANTRAARDGEVSLAPGTKRYARVRRPFSSGRIVSRGKGDWTYGRFEARMKLPTGQGLWPAFWMLPSDYAYGGWAASGEIDIMEAINLGMTCETCEGGREDRVYGTLHYGGRWPDNEYSGANVPVPAPVDGFHTYTVEWSAGRMDWYVDGVHYSTKTQDQWHTDNVKGTPGSDAPFDRPFHLIFNLAVGGNWPEGENDVGFFATDFPKEMVVDWVRVYQCATDPETGKACEKK